VLLQRFGAEADLAALRNLNQRLMVENSRLLEGSHAEAHWWWRG